MDKVVSGMFAWMTVLGETRIPRPVLAELRAIAGSENLRLADGQLAVYARDATPLFRGMPDAVIAPADAEQVARILRLATDHGIPVVPRGAGSNLCAGTVPLTGGIVLSTVRMNRILEVAPEEMLARAETGVSTMALGDAAAAHGLFYPPDPGSRTVSTIGGNVATCAGGLRGLKYGVTRNYVLGLTVVLPAGEIVRTGGRLWKDVAGYDLTRLITGSEGTLGVITEVTVALLPDPPASRTGLAYFDSLTQAGHAVSDILAAGVIPSTLEFLDRSCMDAVEQYAHLGLHPDAGALLLFGDDGDEAVVARSFERIMAVCEDSGAIGVQTAGDVTESEALLTARRCTLPALSRLGSLTILEDASVPRPRLAEMVARIDAIAAGLESQRSTDQFHGDAGARQRAGDVIEIAGRLLAQRQKLAQDFSAALRLRFAGRVQRRVGLTLQPAAGIPVGLAVADVIEDRPPHRRRLTP